jgi:SAM-dependent methyltransferase
MGAKTSQFVGSIPDYYDRGLGPQIFADFAEDLAQRAAALKPARVLETTAGTGIVTRRLRDALPPATAITATDLNPPMLEVARAKFAAGEGVDWRPADAQALPFDDAEFDAVVCQFGVMFYPDKDRSYREAFRVLRRGGRHLFNVWDSFEFNSFARLAHETIGGFFKTDPPQFYLTPFGYFAIDPIKASLLTAGFSGISIDVTRIEKGVPCARRFAEGLVLGNPIAEQIQARAAAEPEDIVAAVSEALEKAFGKDPGRMPLQAIVFSARKT